MNRLRALLSDRRRAQRGSVLSGVLIITAFLAIVAGALMTELSTNFLLSRNLMNRVVNQATVNSAVELAFNQLQSTQISSGCPGFSPMTLNSRTAVVNYVSCAPVVDRTHQYTPILSSNAFNADGTHALLTGLNDYLVGDGGGKVFDYLFGSTTWRWSLDLGGAITGPPVVMPDPARRGRFFDLIPASGPGCSGAGYCMSVWWDDGSSRTPIFQCTNPAGASVAPAAASPSFSQIAFYGDASGSVFAYDVTNGGGGGTCDQEANPAVVGQPVVAAPIVFKCRNCSRSTDELFVLVSDGGSSRLVRLTYRSGSLSAGSSLALPWDSAIGVAVDSTQLPSRVAITFSGGGVALVSIDSNNNMSLSSSTLLSTRLGTHAAPYWCHCPSGADLIGIGGQNGVLYVLDPSLTVHASYAGSFAINTTPAADNSGDWYFAADDGNLHEVPVIQPGSSILSFGSGALGQARSAVQIGSCSAGLCAYLGSADGHLHMVPLDARDVVLTACVAAGGTCSGDKPRLWTSAQVAPTISPPVHVTGFSYYSP